MQDIIILGAGISGFGAASRCYDAGVKTTLYEEKSYHGGHAASYVKEGFVFDDGPHISFTKNKKIQGIFADNVNNSYEVLQAKVNNYWKGRWIKHPAQCNLFGLPEGLIENILVDFIESRNHEKQIVTYEDWLKASFGNTFAETFPMTYGKKFHTIDAKNMTTDWIGVRLYRPNFREILHGALYPSTPDVHYVDHFRYPTHGGFVSYTDNFLNYTDLHLDHKVVKIDPQERVIYFSNGFSSSYKHLISSLPLPEIIPMIENVPGDVLEASKNLACSTCVIVTLGINRPDISDAHWSYFYDDDICFSRVSYPHMLSPNNARPGTGSIQAEIYFSKKYRPLNSPPNKYIDDVIKDLLKCSLLNDTDEILFTDARVIPYANVIFDHDRSGSLSLVHDFLDDIRIRYCGRYGKWGYQWTDGSFMSGENSAQAILDTV